MLRTFFLLITIISLFSLSLEAETTDRLYADREAKKYRTGKIDSRISQVPPGLQKNVFTDPKTYLPKLTVFLTQGAANDYVKAKRIHDWITDNIAYDYDLFYGLSKTGSAQAYSVFQYRRTTCGGYARLFREMARLGGLEVKYVGGYAKSYFNKRRNKPGGHAWNAVKIKEKWYLVDCSADKRIKYNKGKFEEKLPYRDRQLFINPAAKILRNMPRDPQYRFTSGPATVKEFLAAPAFQYPYHEYGLSFLTDVGTMIKKEKEDRPGGRLQTIYDVIYLKRGYIEFLLKCPETTLIRAYLRDKEGNKYPFHAVSYKKGKYRLCRFSAPAAGEYKAYIRAKNIHDTCYFRTAFKFTLKARKGEGMLPVKGNFLYTRQEMSHYGLKILNHRFNPARGEYMIDISYPPTVQIYSGLYDSSNKKIKKALTTSILKNRKRYYYRLPASGTYRIEIRAKRKSKAQGTSSTVALAKAAGGVIAPGPDFPPPGELVQYRYFTENGFTLLSAPSFRNGVYTMRVRAPRGYTMDSRVKDKNKKRHDTHRAVDARGRDYTFYFSSPGGRGNWAAVYRINKAGKWKNAAWFYLPPRKGPELPHPSQLFLNRHFQKNRCRLVSANLKNPPAQIYRVTIEAPVGFTMGSNLKDEGGTKHRRHYRYENSGSRYTFTFTAPGRGRYRAAIYIIDEKRKWTRVGEFVISAKRKGPELP